MKASGVRAAVDVDANGGVDPEHVTTRLVEGEERDRFVGLYLEHRAQLYAFCLAKTNDPLVAEDIVQDVFEKAFSLRSRLDGDRPFWPWLVSVAARECIDVYRRRSYAESRLPDLAGPSAMDADPTAGDVIRRMSRARLAAQIDALPPRQRIALQLFAVDGWTYAQIAAHLGASVGTVKMLILRARQALRDTGVRVLAGFGCGLRGLNRRLQAIVGRAHALPALRGQELSSPSWELRRHAIAACLLLAVGAPETVPHVEGGRGAPPHSAIDNVGGTAGRAGADATVASEPPRASGDRRSERGRGTLAHDAERVAHEAAAPILYRPSDHDTPESASGYSVAVSPSYERDRTIFIAGRDPKPGWAVPLFVTHDGGASWKTLAPRGLSGSATLLLPPAYPDDHRIFALNNGSLRVSRDEGNSFETLPAMSDVADVSVSPLFNAGDPTMLLVAGGRLYEYGIGSLRARPFVLAPELADHLVISVRHGRTYASDGTVLVGTRTVSAGRFSSWFHRCRTVHGSGTETPLDIGIASLQCEGLQLPAATNEPLPVRFSPRDDKAVFVGYGTTLFASWDDGHSFRAVDGGSSFISDIESIPSSHGMSAIVAQNGRGGYDAHQGRWLWGPSLARTDDGGRTWRPLHVDVPGFDYGGQAHVVAVTPTGRIIAVGHRAGMACSVDGGKTWSRLCPSPDAV